MRNVLLLCHKKWCVLIRKISGCHYLYNNVPALDRHHTCHILTQHIKHMCASYIEVVFVGVLCNCVN